MTSKPKTHESNCINVVHYLALDDSALAMLYSTFFDVLVTRRSTVIQQGCDRDGFYQLLESLADDNAIDNLVVNAYGAFTESGEILPLHYLVTRSSEVGVLEWEQTILDSERTGYFSAIYKKPSHTFIVTAPVTTD